MVAFGELAVRLGVEDWEGGAIVSCSVGVGCGVVCMLVGQV